MIIINKFTYFHLHSLVFPSVLCYKVKMQYFWYVQQNSFKAAPEGLERCQIIRQYSIDLSSYR